ncbi:inositol monophosphatase [Candidatus Kaiserbacteria bacterium]|nr:inositol monophosphatase [Candidatus Kaiserbacteria bacterium]
MSFEKELSEAKRIARLAGAVMREHFDGEQNIERKEDDSPVTIADKKINRLVIEELQKEFKDVVIGEEESTGEYGMGRRWICDPIDGTKAYTWGVPTAMFSLGFVVDGVPLVGVAYDPFLDKLYEGQKGAGSFCNGARLAVSHKGITEGYIAVTSSVEKIIADPRQIIALEQRGARFAAFSGAVYKMCLIASGRILGHAGKSENAHDVVAAHVIVEEAGGTVTSLSGGSLDYSQPFKGVILSNGVVHQDLVECYRE